MADAEEMLAYDVEIGGRKQVMDVGDAAGDRILDRDHRKVDVSRLNVGEHVLDGRLGNRLEAGVGLGASEM
jgi:hypothetical protein